MAKILKMRRGQRRFMRMVDQYRIAALLARRQYGKTTIFAKIALKKMMKKRDHTVIFGSAKLNLSREIVRTEARILQTAIQVATGDMPAAAAMLKVFDSKTDKAPDKLIPDDFAEIFEAQRLEFRLYHTSTTYSRTKVVALGPDTVGETGDLMCDELRAIKNWREVWEAVKPIISSNPAFRCTLSTTVPTDDAHYAYGQLLPPVGLDFEPSPDGNLYESQGGIVTLRVDAWDAYADGVPLYDDKTGEPISPEESRRQEQDKDAWDRNYGLVFIAGGTAACGITQLDVAQRRGIGKCLFVLVDSDSDFDRALEVLATRLGPGKVGIGFDVATTEKGYSNPSSVSVCEQDGIEYSYPLTVAWKTADPAIATERLRRIIETVARRPKGGRARALDIDATNERYFATSLREEFRGLLPVHLIIGSETVKQPGYEPMTMKQFLGSRLVAELDDNHLTLAPERYIRDDWRLVKKDRGVLVCDVDVDGKHGDTFDSAKLALNAVVANGPVEATSAPISNISPSFSPSLKGGRRSPALV